MWTNLHDFVRTLMWIIAIGMILFIIFGHLIVLSENAYNQVQTQTQTVIASRH
jgi:hypothetical protein